MPRWFGIAGCLAVLVCSSPAAAEPDGLSIYTEQLKPLFRKSCVPCHGALKQEAGLRLDTVAAMRDAGILDSQAPEASLLLDRVRSDELGYRMPPEHEGEPLADEDLERLKRWMAAGARAPADERPESDPADHWAFRPIERPAVPQLARAELRIRNPIDAFVARKQQELGIAPQREAGRLVLLRRLHFDLIGLPPDAASIDRWEVDRRPEEPIDERAYQQSVDRLLEDPRHGQRWARHWMDIWRYSDWWGLNAQLRNSQRHMWHWRDWIVESLNGDLPYDEMVRCMLAADELYPGDQDRVRATGFLARNYFLFNRNQWMEETVEHVGKGLLGLTLNCAKCHDHKYDPIAQKDFYRMRAFFEPYHVRLDFVEGCLDPAENAIPRVFDGELETPTYRFIRGEEGNADESEVMRPQVPELLRFAELEIEPVTLPPVAYQPARRPWVFAAYRRRVAERIAAAEQRLGELRRRASETPEAVSEAALRAAARALDLANAEQSELEARIVYQRTLWRSEDGARDTEISRDVAARRAIRANRRLQWARAESRLAAAELQLAKLADAGAEDPKRKQALDARAKAEQARDAARVALAEPIGEAPRPEALVAAQWSATRFQHSGRDDPTIAFPSRSSGRRAALARWITDPRNPLTARVAVNHIWTRHMGRPLVASVFNFGRSGSPPTHPQLLDWLAAELIDSGWSMKHLHRLIVSSSTYRLASTTRDREASLAADPENRTWWRREPLRLESQLVRDAVLQLAGKLDCRLGGPSVPTAEQTNSRRRSLYFFHSKNERSLFLTTFDEARVTDCYRRETSVVPQQALAMSNSQLVLDAAGPIADRLSATCPDEASFIRRAFLELLGMEVSQREMQWTEAAMGRWRELAEGNMRSCRQWLVWVLLNHNDFVTVR